LILGFVSGLVNEPADVVVASFAQSNPSCHSEASPIGEEFVSCQRRNGRFLARAALWNDNSLGDSLRRYNFPLRKAGVGADVKLAS
jgi:hypothetical protein